MFSCPLCSKIFVIRLSLKSHTSSHAKEKPHKCVTCSAAFGLASTLKRHVSRIHEDQKKTSHCSLCSYKCHDKTKLEIHLRKHFAQLPFSCNVFGCGFKTKYENNIQKHVRQVHSDERPYECPSEECSYKSKTRRDLKTHLKIHSSEKPFTCKVPGCHYACKMNSYLTEHMTRAHSDEKPFKCSLCDFQGKSRSNLNHHRRTHMKIKPFQCQVPNCGFATCEKKILQLHVESKHTKKDVFCTEPRCNFRCGSTALLKAHLKRHGNPMLKCPGESCNCNTRFKTTLLKHISHYHGDGKCARTVVEPRVLDTKSIGTAGAMETLHYCSFPNCGYPTKYQHHLDRHRISHDKEEKREHVCALCFSRFTELSILKAHVERHIQEKPFSCSYCNYATVSSLELRRHSRAIHRIYVTSRGKENQKRECRTCSEGFWSYSEFVLHSMTHLQPIVVLERLHIIET